MYKTIPRAYLVGSHRERRITGHRRDGERWIMRSAVAGGKVAVEAVACELVVEPIYRRAAIK